MLQKRHRQPSGIGAAPSWGGREKKKTKLFSLKIRKWGENTTAKS